MQVYMDAVGVARLLVMIEPYLVERKGTRSLG